MSRTVRTFIAIPLPEPVRHGVARLQEYLRPQLPDIRWTTPDNLHLTLRFLGEQPEDSLEKLSALVLSVGSSNRCFQLTFSGIDAFPSWHRGRVIWLGFNEPELVSQLHRKLSTGLGHLGLPEEDRTFRPHLTLGRSRRMAPLPPLAVEVRRKMPAGFTVERLTLYRSTLTPQGARHTEVACARLKP